ncbi:response regulator transcription factor [Kitasatospora sp. NPDC008050]|uniref:response regulator transcription factor n=1 Tax=Kitasatospora sp. NPDC008050 TaxID=3364021 RepID=UPI0036EF0A57
MAAIAATFDRIHLALSAVQNALDAQEKVIENLLTDAGADTDGTDSPSSAESPDLPERPEPPVESGPGSTEALSLLTAREREILVLVARGNSNRHVANCLGISEKTVKNHLSAVFSKLGASDRTHAVVMGIRGGIVAIGDRPAGARLDDAWPQRTAVSG